MAFQSYWINTDIPDDIINILEKDISENFDSEFKVSELTGGIIDRKKRNSKNAWIPTSHWICGFLWHYVTRANRENFLYDVTNIDQESVQYTLYGEGHYYGWHNDSSISCYYKPTNVGSSTEILPTDFVNKNSEFIRKLSFSLQLSDPNDYEGGNLQLIDEEGKTYFAPRKKGTIIIFDSRTQHRVLKVTKGERKSIVGWVVGPRWR
jgi:predicted 2-oxoglutarate/Fe(II)-dependent dioxygenase YbiX